jgi:hypothetical protein
MIVEPLDRYRPIIVTGEINWVQISYVGLLGELPRILWMVLPIALVMR